MKIIKNLRDNLIWFIFRRLLQKKIRNSMKGWISSPFIAKFKEFFLIERIDEKLKTLKSGLDDESQKHIDVFISRMLNFPGCRYSNATIGIWDKIIRIDGLPYDKKRISHFIKKNVKPKFILPPPSHFPAEVFYFDHGLKFLSQRHLDYLKGGDFIDCGAFIGDSALTLIKYQPHKIYSFESFADIAVKFEEVMRQNGINKNLVEVFNLATGDTQTDKSIPKSMGVDVVNLDDFIEERGLSPTLIKMDVEGWEISTILGARQSIKKFKPILTIAIYHEPKQFFDLKSILESWNLGYKFMVRSLRPETVSMEMTLVAIPTIQSH